MKRIITFFILLVSAVPAELFAQQDPLFSQYMFNPLAINPAWAGSREMMNAALLMRRQWVGFPGAPSTNVLAISAPTRKGKVGWGLEINTDQIGPKRSTAAYLSYAYRIRMGKGKLGFGLGAGIISYRVNWNQIEYRDENDVFATLSSDKRTIPDFKFGVFFNNKRFYWGFSSTHLNRPSYSVVAANDSVTYASTLRRHLFFTIGRAFVISDNVLFSPSVMIRNYPGTTLTAVDINLNFELRKMIWVGASLRSSQSIVGLVQYNAGQFLRIGYSYDFALGRLRSAQSGSHELMVGFNLDLFKSETLSPRYF
ncbi:MAG: type IX secretion system membrane protein PorP/SprF [Bacteroidetes bacterium]|nr:type IX secretion system membrane protein PorP/SprF [Bacteroidota bacterium]